MANDAELGTKNGACGCRGSRLDGGGGGGGGSTSFKHVEVCPAQRQTLPATRLLSLRAGARVISLSLGGVRCLVCAPRPTGTPE